MEGNSLRLFIYDIQRWSLFVYWNTSTSRNSNERKCTWCTLTMSEHHWRSSCLHEAPCGQSQLQNVELLYSDRLVNCWMLDRNWTIMLNLGINMRSVDDMANCHAWRASCILRKHMQECHGGQFESLEHTGGGPDQKIIKDQCQTAMEHNAQHSVSTWWKDRRSECEKTK